MRETDVLIVGGGLIGLTASLLLSDLGVDHVLVDRRPSTSDHPRARFYDRRTLELLRRFGVAEAVEATGLGDLWTRQNRWLESLSGEQIAEVPTTSFRMAPETYSPSIPVMGAQDLIEEALLRRARESDCADIRFHTQAEDLAQDSESCSAVLRDLATDVLKPVRSRYVIAADGVHSRIRDQIGCPLAENNRFDFHLQDILFHADLSRWVGDRLGGLLFIRSRYGMGVYQPMDGAERWRMQLPNWDRSRGELSEAEARRYIVEAVGVDASELNFEIESMLPWRFIAGLAERFSRDRIFLAGDAAHAFIPTGGVGSNTGFSGIHNLAWKMAYVLKGYAPAALLDSYEQEHRPVAERRVGLSVENALRAGAIMNAYETGGDVDEAERECLQYGSYEGMILACEYKSQLCQAEEFSPPAVDNELVDFVPVVRGGQRAPHAWLDPQQTVSTLDWFGTDYVVMVCDRAYGSRLADLQIAVERYRRDGFPIRVERLRHTANTPYAHSEAVMVRPDGVVAAHTMPAEQQTPAELLQRYLPVA